MKIYLIAVGNKIPNWITEGYNEFAKRLNQEITLHLIEIQPAQRQKYGNRTQYKNIEAKRINQAIPRNSYLIVLDERGKQLNSQGLSNTLQKFLHMGTDISLVIGGADGLSKTLIESAKEKWSLSKLTFAHAHVRLLVAEQIYRAWSIMHKHPYHRE